MTFKAACVQLRSTRSIDDNIETASTLITKAAQDGAAYVQTPEMTHLVETGSQNVKAKIALEQADRGVAAFSDLARSLRIWLHIGSLAIDRGDGKVANRAFLFAPDGGLAGTYDKIHMFDVDLDHGESWRESNTYEPGVTSPVFETDMANIGMAICYDLRFPALFRRQAHAGAHVLTAPACFTKQTGRAHWHTLLRARAIENHAFVVAAAQGGRHEDGRETFGHSLIVDPWGAILAEADGDDPCVIMAEIDLAALDTARTRIPVLTHEREFDTAFGQLTRNKTVTL
ncbi:MAG: carbon-nitrogen hydrolase family protein [Pseudomonadota bacterium]